MKKLKLSIIGMAVAAFAVLAAPNALATTLNLPTGQTITAEAEGSVTLDPPFGTLSCEKSKISGETTNEGGSSETVKVTVNTFTEEGCNATFTVLKKGTLEIHTKTGSADNNGTLTWTGTELTTEYIGTHCIFTTSNTDVGTITGSATTGGNATFDISATIPRTGGRSGAFCGVTASWTGSYKFTCPSKLNIDGESKRESCGGEGPKLSGEAPTGIVSETATITWKNTGGKSATINDETVSDETVLKTTGTACATIAAGGSCTNRKVECLKKGEATLTIRDTTAGVVGEVKMKCDQGELVGEVPTGTIGETYTVTWKNTGPVSATVEDESNSNSEVAETLGSGCGTISAGGSCTSRKVKCLKEGEATLTARDTPAVEGKVTIKCDKPNLEGGPSTGKVGETVTVTWTNNTGSSLVIEDESTSDGTVAETLGTSCGTIASKGSCTSRKIKCLKAGESTITAVDTPSVEGKFIIKCS